MDIESRFAKMSPELRAKVEACTTPEELLELAKDEGIHLGEEEMELIAGGGEWSTCSKSREQHEE